MTSTVRSAIGRRLRFVTLATFIFAAFSLIAGAQDQPAFPVIGYITAIPSHSGDVTEFLVNTLRVVVRSETSFGLIGDKTTTNVSPLRAALQVGAYVQVAGQTDHKTKSTIASTIYFRPDWNKPLTGIGVIDKVLKPAPDPVYRADGYFVRITQSTDVTFAEGMRSLDDVGTDNWISFQGKQDPSGVLIASKIAFLPSQSVSYRNMLGVRQNYSHKLMPAGAKTKVAPPVPTSSDDADSSRFPPREKPQINPQTGRRVDFEKILDQDGNLTQNAVIRYGALGSSHTIRASTPAQKALQARVRSIGERVIPAYQKAMLPDNPSKIRFEFYAVDDKGLRTDLCPSIGLIVVSQQAVERLQNDDQLAALLADGIAFNMQRQAARSAEAARAMLGPAIAANLMLQAVPVLDIVPILTENKIAKEIYLQQFEERGRVSLGLLADAGYDPWQVPETWRRLQSRHAAKDSASILYSDYSGYLLGVLNLEYPKQQNQAKSGGHLNQRHLNQLCWPL